MREQLINRSPSHGLIHSFVRSLLVCKLLLCARQGARHSLGYRNSLEFRAERQRIYPQGAHLL